MTTTAAFGWGSSHLNTTPAGEVDLDPAERLAVQQTLAPYVFALDHGDLVTLAGVLTEDATWTVNIAGEVEQGPSSDARRFSTWCEMQRKRKPISEGTT